MLRVRVDEDKHFRTFQWGLFICTMVLLALKKQKHISKYSTTHKKHNYIYQLIHPTIIHSFITLFIHRTIHSFIILFIHHTYSFIHHTIHSFIILFIHHTIHSSHHSFIHSFTHSFTPSFIRHTIHIKYI